jgi:tripartite-type tricarboxylate transporter receptor subunit TctC
VVENRAAAGSGTVTSRAVAHGPADGYTIMLGYTSTLATGPHIFPDVGYDVRKDFTPIGSIGMAPALIVVHPSVPYRTIADLIAAMKASKEPFQVGTPGVSTVNHLSALLFAEQAGVKLQYIPYKGSQPLNTDLIGGFVKVGFNPIPVSRAAIEGNLTRALAATSLKRSAAFPDLPTVAESGLPGYDAVLTYGLVAPGGTPRPIIDKLSKALREVLATDEVKKRLAQEGAEPMSTSPEEYAAVIDREDTKWSAIIKSAGIKAK